MHDTVGHSLASALLYCLLIGPPRAAAGAVLIPLEPLPDATVPATNAIGVSADGSTVVGVSGSPSGNQAFIWTASGGMVGAGDLPGGDSSSYFTAVSADGRIAVGVSSSSTGEEAVLWTESGGMIGLGYVPGGALVSRATNISGDGSTVVGYGYRGGYDLPYEAFRWNAIDGMVGLGFGPYATDVSFDGSVIVGLEPFMGIRWTAEGGAADLGDLPGGAVVSQAHGVSSDGRYVVGTSVISDLPTDSEAFLWTEGEGMIALGDLPRGNHSSKAVAVSDDGSVVVGTGMTERGFEAFVWGRAHGMRSIADVLREQGVDVSDWELSFATDLSADGRVIVGYGGRKSSSYAMGWIAVLPEPESVALTLAGLVGAFSLRMFRTSSRGSRRSA